MNKPLVAVVMGSDSDLPVMKAAVDTLRSFGIEHEVTIVSAHRTPKKMVEYAAAAEGRGVEVIIAGAGGAAHLAGMFAAVTTLPVIGVPIASPNLNGLDALLAMVQMPSGVPVATVAIDGARNAAILAAEILALKYPAIKHAVADHKKELEKSAEEKSKKLAGLGVEGYLAQKGKQAK